MVNRIMIINIAQCRLGKNVLNGPNKAIKKLFTKLWPKFRSLVSKFIITFGSGVVYFNGSML